MKIIHCADLHLNSSMTANLTKEKAKERKAELLRTFVRMVDYAVEEEVRAIIIAGDLFDQNRITKTTRNAVYDQIRLHPSLDFYYLQGNHDADSFLNDMEELPDNLKLFEKQWKTYLMDGDHGRRIAVTGIELSAENRDSVYHSLVLDADCFNIVVMHGQESELRGKDKTEVIALRELRDKGIDYLALGHIHSYKADRLDARGTYCYCGCLEGRGFDECGEHGFVLLDIDEDRGTYEHTFVPFAGRLLYEVVVDISGCQTTAEIEEQVETVLAQKEISPKSMVKIVLTGELAVDDEKDPELLEKQLEDRFYYVKVKDESGWRIDYQEYELDESLKGEFIRTVQRSELSEEDKAEIIRYGIQALAGEEIQ